MLLRILRLPRGPICGRMPHRARSASCADFVAAVFAMRGGWALAQPFGQRTSHARGVSHALGLPHRGAYQDAEELLLSGAITSDLGGVCFEDAPYGCGDGVAVVRLLQTQLANKRLRISPAFDHSCKQRLCRRLSDATLVHQCHEPTKLRAGKGQGIKALLLD